VNDPCDIRPRSWVARLLKRIVLEIFSRKVLILIGLLFR
jgi:hypothetical protein